MTRISDLSQNLIEEILSRHLSERLDPLANNGTVCIKMKALQRINVVKLLMIIWFSWLFERDSVD
ncbi:LOW QUALITY PROTEIN: hypothetical protein YC2023_061604 [Brassica napus]